MRIQSTDNKAPSMKAGLYFTSKSNVLFNPKARYITKEPVKVSADGFRYIEDTNISQEIKDKFANIPFIQALSEIFDTFIFFRELPVGSKNNFGVCNIALAKISWANSSMNGAQVIEAFGESPISQEYANKKCFEDVNKNNIQK